MKIKFLLLLSILLAACEPISLPDFSSTNSVITDDENKSTLPSDSSFISGKVIKVTDGDTYKILVNENFGNEIHAGETITIRALLIDTPESVGPNAGMIYGVEASKFAKDLIEGKDVELEFGEQGHLTDKYGRYLAYVYIDSKRVQDILIENGMAMIRYIIEPNTRYLEELRCIEKGARDKKVGIWSIENYVIIEEGFNEVENKAAVTENISSDLETILVEEGEKLTEQLIDEALKSLMEQLESK